MQGVDNTNALELSSHCQPCLKAELGYPGMQNSSSTRKLSHERGKLFKMRNLLPSCCVLKKQFYPQNAIDIHDCIHNTVTINLVKELNTT